MGLPKRPLFTCETCGETFAIEPGWDAQAEAEATFRTEELADAGVVCDECWKAMRADMPDLDARYQERGL